MTEAVESLGLRAEQAAKMLGIGRTTFLLMHRSGRIPLPRRFGRATVWDKRELADWFAAGSPPRARWEVIKNSRV